MNTELQIKISADNFKQLIFNAIKRDYAQLVIRSHILGAGSPLRQLQQGANSNVTLEDFSQGIVEIKQLYHNRFISSSYGKKVLSCYLNALEACDDVKSILALGADSDIQRGTNLKKVLAQCAIKAVYVLDENEQAKSIDDTDKKLVDPESLGTLIMLQAANKLRPYEHTVQHKLYKAKPENYAHDEATFSKTEAEFKDYLQSSELAYAENLMNVMP